MATMPQIPQLQPMETADPLQKYGQAVALKQLLQQQAFQQQMQPLQLQAEQNQLTQQQYQLGRTQAINSALKQAYTIDPNTGTPSLNVPMATQILANHGYGEAANDIIESHTKMLQGMATLAKTKGEVRTQEQDLAGQLGYTTKQAQYDPGVLQHGLELLQQDYPNEITPILNQLKQNPTPQQAQVIADRFMGNSQKVQDLLNKQAETTAREWKVLDGQLVNPVTNQTYAPQNGMLPVPEDFARAAGRPDMANVLVPPQLLTKMKEAVDQGLTFTQANGRDLLVDKTTGAVKKDMGTATPLVTMGMQLQAGKLSDAALDQQTEVYVQTGKLPGLRGPAGNMLNRQIMENAAAKYPNLQLAPNSAEFKANAQSLSNLQKQYDQAMAFENTAQKNFNLAQDLAKKIPDIGARIGNVAVRNVTANMVGPENLAAFNTAIDVASTEAAKVLSSATAAGGLTDTQKRDLQAVVDKNLPYNSLVAVFDTLRQDMNNRRAGYLDQINDIRGRMGSSAPPPGMGTAPQTGDIKTYNGRNYKFDGTKWVGQ